MSHRTEEVWMDSSLGVDHPVEGANARTAAAMILETLADSPRRTGTGWTCRSYHHRLFRLSSLITALVIVGPMDLQHVHL